MSLDIRELNLNRSAVTDAGMKELARLKKLETLDLGDTQVSDAGLEHLAELRNLRELILDDTWGTTTGFEKLRATHPHCRISLNFEGMRRMRPLTFRLPAFGK